MSVVPAGAVLIRKVCISGETPQVGFVLKDSQTGEGFKPATLTMSVYDVDACAVPPTQAIVNERNDVDVLEFIDTDGRFSMLLDAADTTVEVPEMVTPSTVIRNVLFTATWDDPVKVKKLLIALTIAPDRETVAS